MTREPRILGRFLDLYILDCLLTTICVFLASQPWIKNTDCSCWDSASPTWPSHSPMHSFCASGWHAVGRGCGGVPQLHQAHPRDVPRRGGATHAETTEERHVVQRLAGDWTEGGHHTQAPGHRGLLQVVDVPVICAAQHHLPFSPGRLPGHLGRVRRRGGLVPTRRQLRGGRRSLQATPASGTFTMC